MGDASRPAIKSDKSAIFKLTIFSIYVEAIFAESTSNDLVENIILFIVSGFLIVAKYFVVVSAVNISRVPTNENVVVLSLLLLLFTKVAMFILLLLSLLLLLLLCFS